MEIRHLLEPTDDALVALCALLVEMAHIDGQFSDDEALLLLDLFGAEIARSTVRGEALLARAQARLRMTPDLAVLAGVVREHFSADERAAVVGLLWQVALADGRLDTYEAYLLRRLGALLEVPPERINEERHSVLRRLGR